jgi:hypothetical protein
MELRLRLAARERVAAGDVPRGEDEGEHQYGERVKDLGRPVQEPVVWAELSEWVREVFGNPFRPAALDPAWVTPAALGLAQAAYQDGAFDTLPILADALEEAGCDDAELLAHLRGPGPHTPGCWAVDAVLAKESGPGR